MESNKIEVYSEGDTTEEYFVFRQEIQQDSSTSWLICVIAFLWFFLFFGFVSAHFILLEDIANTLSVPNSYVTFIFSSTTAFMFIHGLLSGVISDYFGYRKMIFIGGTLAFLGLISTAFVRTIWQMFLTFSVAFGLGMSWSLVPIVCLLNQYFYHYKVLAGGIAISGWGFGAFFIAVINYLLVDLMNWEWIMFMYGSISGVLIFISFFYVKSRHHQKPLRDNIISLLFPYISSRLFFQLLISTVLLSIGIFIPFPYLIPYVDRVDGEPSSWVYQELPLLIIMLISFSNAISRLLFGFLGQKFGLLKLMKISFLCLLVIIPFWQFCIDIWSILLFVLFYGFFVGTLISLLPPLVISYFPAKECSGIIIGLFSTAIGIGLMVGMGISSSLILYGEEKYLLASILADIAIFVGLIIYFTLPAPNSFLWVFSDGCDSETIETIKWDLVGGKPSRFRDLLSRCLA